MSTPNADLTVSNTGTRRVVVGPPARSAGGGKPIKFDAAADSEVPADKRLGALHTLKGKDAERVRGSKTVEALKDRLGLRLS